MFKYDIKEQDRSAILTVQYNIELELETELPLAQCTEQSILDTFRFNKKLLLDLAIKDINAEQDSNNNKILKDNK